MRSVGRNSQGVRGVRFKEAGDEVIGMVCVDDENSHIMVVSENGYGKRSVVSDYRITNRGGMGVKTINVTEKTGNLIAILNVTDEYDLMIIKKRGVAIRMNIAEIRVAGRATQGVRLVTLKNTEQIGAICKVPKEDEDEKSYDEDGNLIENSAESTEENAAEDQGGEESTSEE